MGIERDATLVLQSLASSHRGTGDTPGRHAPLEAKLIQASTGLTPGQLSDAVDLLDDNGYVRVQRALGTAPYSFLFAEITPRGRFESERVEAAVAQPNQTVQRSIIPVGSPYGFTDLDWSAATVDRHDPTRLIVCLGMQWQSAFYNSDSLAKNVESMFAAALTAATAGSRGIVSLDFRKLEGGYGGHLFNRIARDIISSDIAVFDTSDQNPNVMIELGVALTWGTPVLPVRAASAPRPPSDISGQTWAEYTGDAEQWVDRTHAAKLEHMVGLALRKKGSL